MMNTYTNLNNEIEFNIKVTMNKRWVDDFCSMLKWMEKCGQIGHSSFVGFYSDGDGDFRPKFDIGINFNTKSGIEYKKILRKPEIMWDAG